MTTGTLFSELLPELVKQAPSLLVVGLVSLGFMYLVFRYLQSRDKEQQIIFHEAMNTIKENSKILGQVQSLLQHLLFASSRSLGNPGSDDGKDTNARDTISES